MPSSTLRTRCVAILCLTMVGLGIVPATETENHGLRILPVPGPVVIDGTFSDWDLTGGIFACGDVVNLRDQYSVWTHAMYDADYLYVLSRWKDPTPLNHPGSATGDFGFNGDCLQVRFITAAGTADERVSHWTCWRDRAGVEVVSVDFGRDFKGGSVPRALEQGAKQALAVDAGGNGYVQELALPWKLLTKDGRAPKPGVSLLMTLEPNFTAGEYGRITIKDLFATDVAKPDRVFTFRAYDHWGTATLAPGGQVQPQPVRLADSRVLPVTMKDGLPSANWSTLISHFEWPGFKPIPFVMPFDGVVSLNILDQSGVVVRQLLTAEIRTKGEQVVQWDGLTTPTYRTPGVPVPAGAYTVKAIAHPGVSLPLRGFASYSGSAPWESGPTTVWGGDHGVPIWCATEGDSMYLAWDGAEAGRHLVATDLQGKVRWGLKNTLSYDPSVIAVADGIIYELHGFGGTVKPVIGRVDAAKGIWSFWQGRQSAAMPIAEMWNDPVGKPEHFDGLDARAGKLYATSTDKNLVAMFDGASGKELKTWPIPKPGAVRAGADGILYVICDGRRVVALDVESGTQQEIIGGLNQARSVAIDAQGRFFVSVRGDQQQVLVFGVNGKAAGSIGRPGGRAPIGPWQPDGMLAPEGLSIDREGKLWVMEADFYPKRISVWDPATNNLVKDFFGPTHYGASGGAINPRDPNLMVGEGCEWKIDATTGLATCLGVFDRSIHGFACFREGANGKLYLITTEGGYGTGGLRVFERLGDGQYALRSALRPDDAKTRQKTVIWTDANGDGKEQPNELQECDGWLSATGSNGWSINIGLDLTIYPYNTKTKRIARIAVTDYSACGAPRWDVAGRTELPDAVSEGYQNNYSCAIPSGDGSRLLTIDMGNSGKRPSEWRCFDIVSGKHLWSYPNPWFQVHGSHKAPAPDPGLFRGAFGPVGIFTLPNGCGSGWAINGNLGEWHLLTDEGFYLSRVFEGNPFKWQWPAQAVPGVLMDACPAGGGQEDFGGSLTQGKDGRIFIQAGNRALVNIQVTGLDGCVPLPTGTVSISASDVTQATALREQGLQAVSGVKQYAIHRATPVFTGRLADDFTGSDIADYRKNDNAAVRTALAWDDSNLYLGFEVKDSSPWVNGAVDPVQMYSNGDTIDLQLSTDAQAASNREEAGANDLRLSIGNFQGQPTAVIYRKVSPIKKPRMFSSGVIKEYTMDQVEVVAEAKITITLDAGKGYTVQAAIPLASLGLSPSVGKVIHGDFGVTHGDAAGQRTHLRTYWSNQQTGLVADVVLELQMQPSSWGTFIFAAP